MTKQKTKPELEPVNVIEVHLLTFLHSFHQQHLETVLQSSENLQVRDSCY